MPISPGHDESWGSDGHLRVQPPIVIADDNALQAFMRAAADAPALSVDTESNSLFVYYPQICLIQISLPQADYVIDPLVFDVTPLGDLFAHPGCQKVFHAAENDMLGLKRDFGFDFANIFDTMMAARILGWQHAGLAAILAERFGVTLDKSLQRTDWGQRPLHPRQLAYAQLDTHYLLPLRDQQLEELAKLGRLEEALEAFDRLPSLTWTEKPFDPDAFWSVTGARGLEPNELAVLRELFLFREQEAQHDNRPPFKVLDQTVLVSLSREQPMTSAALRRVRGLSAGQVRRYGAGILEAIRRGQRSLPPEPPRRSGGNGRPDAATMARYEALRNWRREQAERRGVDPDIVLTNDQLMAIARQAPSSPERLAATNIVSPWKLREYGPAILRVLARA